MIDEPPGDVDRRVAGRLVGGHGVTGVDVVRPRLYCLNLLQPSLEHGPSGWSVGALLLQLLHHTPVSLWSKYTLIEWGCTPLTP